MCPLGLCIGALDGINVVDTCAATWLQGHLPTGLHVFVSFIEYRQVSDIRRTKS